MEYQHTPRKKTTVYLPLDLERQIRERLKQTRRSYNSEIVWLLEQQLAKHEPKDKSDAVS